MTDQASRGSLAAGSAHAQAAAPAPSADGYFDTPGVVTLSIGHAVHDTYSAFLPPLLPAFIENLSISTTEAGILSAFMQAPALLQPFIGHLADRVNLRYLVVIAPALTATVMSLLGTAPAYGVLAVLLVVSGISSACIHAVGPVMAGNLSGRRLGRGMGFWMVGGELGRTLGPIVIVSAVGWLTLRGTAWLMLAGLLASLLLALRLRGVPVRPSSAPGSLPWRQALRGMRPLMVPLAGIVLARSFMAAALTTYLPTFLSSEGAGLWSAGASLSLLEAAGVAGALLGGTLSDRLGRRWVLFISLLATPLLMFAFLGLKGWARLPLLVPLGLTALCTGPVIIALVLESFPNNRALANGTYMGLSFLIRTGAVVAFGALGDAFGLRPAYTASAIIPLLGLPLLLLLPERRPGTVSDSAGTPARAH